MLTGGGGVIGPDGQWIAGPVHNEETIIYADLDLDHAARERYAMDIVGHYNRPDIFSLTVDARPRAQISWLRGPNEPALDALVEEPVSTEAVPPVR